MEKSSQRHPHVNLLECVFLPIPFSYLRSDPTLNTRGIPFSRTRRYTDGGFGCRSGYGKVWRSSVSSSTTIVIKTERWTRVHSPVFRAADCRPAGPWFNSGRRHWIHTHWHIQRNNIMSPITTTITMPITTIPRKSVNKLLQSQLPNFQT